MSKRTPSILTLINNARKNGYVARVIYPNGIIFEVGQTGAAFTSVSTALPQNDIDPEFEQWVASNA